MCAILFACTKFHDYIFGQRTTIITDCKPLVGVFGKPFRKLSPRLQRMRMHLFRYDLEVTWKPGKEMFIPDTLSRAVLQDPPGKTEFDDAVEVNLIIGQLPVTDSKLGELRVQTAADPVLQTLIQHVTQGWPYEKQLVPTALLPFYPFRDELVFCDGLVFRENQIVIPRSMQQEMLNKIHSSHQVKAKSLQCAFLARNEWPNRRNNHKMSCVPRK